MSARLRSPLPFALFAAGALAAVAATVCFVVMALLGAQLSCMAGGGGGAQPPAGGTALGGIPTARFHIYQAAGDRFDISWPFLASIGTQECGSGDCASVNPSGCAGPMEIAYVRGSACSPGSGPTIWERFRVDADGGGASIFDPADAVFTAARIFRRALGAPLAGGSYHAYYEAACGYYGACADATVDYAHEVMARAVSYGFGGAAERTAGGAEGSPAPAGPSCEGSSLAGEGASASAIVRIAERQLGAAESPLGSNCSRYGPCEEWCALFVAWVWEHAGVPMKGGTAPYAYSGTIGEWAAAHGGRLLPPGATPSPGDAVLYGWGPKASEHVGIVERVLPGPQIVTIDGNFGDRVARVGPFPPSLAVADGEPAPIYAYAEPPVDGPSEASPDRG
jgi:hypothetical protein